MGQKFEVGDKIICINDDYAWYSLGEVYTISRLAGWKNDKEYFAYNVEAEQDKDVWIDERDFELVEEKAKSGGFKPHTSIERPVLEERKLGKVRMELFDSGFPNAILEIAKVMTWANQNKGYKDNDWKALPDAEKGFKGAAARHRVKFDAQRAMGFEPLDCVDEESNITHLAHECFNNLALLESVLMGRIK